MLNGEYRTERRYNGKNIIIDLADVGSLGDFVKYEVMAIYKNGLDFDSYRTNDLDSAIFAYNGMCEKYQDKEPEAPKPLTGKYAKLRDDLKIALAAGIAAEGTEDGGTCNFDACAVKLPRWKKALVKQAAEEAGTGMWIWDFYGHKDFVFEPNTRGQANKRSRNADAMTACMRSLGYEAMEYNAMD